MVAFTRVYQQYQSPRYGARNLWLYDAASQTTTAVPGFDSPQTVENTGDSSWGNFKGGVLTWVQGSFNISTGGISGHNVMKYKVGADATPIQVTALVAPPSQGPVTNGTDVVWAYCSSQGSDTSNQLYLWDGTSTQRITTGETYYDFGDNRLGIGDNWIVYNKTGQGIDLMLAQNIATATDPNSRHYRVSSGTPDGR